MLEIVDNKKIKAFLKTFNDINQLFKNIYCNETNFSPIYTFENDKVFYYNKEALPNYLELVPIDIEKSINEWEFSIDIDSVKFFQFLRDNKTEVNKITLDDSGVLTITSINNVISFPKSELSSDFSKDYSRIKEIKGKKITKQQLSPDIINKIINEKDVTKFNIVEGDFELPVFLQKKFLNGSFYRIKRLVKGDVVDYSKIYFTLYSTDRENVYLFDLFVETKYGNVEHIFMVSGF